VHYVSTSERADIDTALVFASESPSLPQRTAGYSYDVSSQAWRSEAVIAPDAIALRR